jgi:hypothetical protein
MSFEYADKSIMKIRFLVPLFLFLTIANAFAINPEVRKYLYYETKGNAAADRSNAKVLIKHFEIPLEIIEKDFSDRFPSEIRESLIFEKNGEKYVRWIINPEDTKWKSELTEYLQKKGLSTTEHQYFDAYQTASRSYVLHDPKSEATFSLKVSTNKTGGNWTDKKQTMADSFETRIATDYIQKIHRLNPFKNFKMLDEPAAFGIKEIDQGMMIRSLNELPQGKFIYLPGFTAVHDKIGEEIAHLNGYEDPAKFWNENYNKPLARSLAELSAKAGVTYDSPHSQNFLIELDHNLRPTGKIIFKDMGDIYLNKRMVKAFGGEKLIKAFPDENIYDNKIRAAVGILHGNSFPSWLSDEQYSQWGDDFYKEFDQELMRQTGVAREDIPTNWDRQGLYFSKSVETDSKAWNSYIEKTANRVAPRPPSLLKAGFLHCEKAYQQIFDY